MHCEISIVLSITEQSGKPNIAKSKRTMQMVKISKLYIKRNRKLLISNSKNKNKPLRLCASKIDLIIYFRDNSCAKNIRNRNIQAKL